MCRGSSFILVGTITLKYYICLSTPKFDCSFVLSLHEDEGKIIIIFLKPNVWPFHILFIFLIRLAACFHSPYLISRCIACQITKLKRKVIVHFPIILRIYSGKDKCDKFRNRINLGTFQIIEVFNLSLYCVRYISIQSIKSDTEALQLHSQKFPDWSELRLTIQTVFFDGSILWSQSLKKANSSVLLGSRKEGYGRRP